MKRIKLDVVEDVFSTNQRVWLLLFWIIKDLTIRPHQGLIALDHSLLCGIFVSLTPLDYF